MQNIFKAKGQRLVALIGMIALVAIIGFSSLSCVINMNDDTPNHSLNGTWKSGGWTIRISGDTGTITRLVRSELHRAWQSAYDRDLIYVGKVYLKNIEPNGYLQWRGYSLFVNYNTSNYYANYVDYAIGGCILSMAEDGKSFTETSTDSGVPGSLTWYRQ